MKQLPAFEFPPNFRLRPATQDDLTLARAWTAEDPDHVWELGQEGYWVEQTLVANSYLLEDKDGPVFFLKLMRGVHAEGFQGPNHWHRWAWDNDVQINMQFNRACDRDVKLRTMEGLIYGWPWLERMLADAGVSTVYFQSKNERLIRFAEKWLGFGRDLYGGSDRLFTYVTKAA